MDGRAGGGCGFGHLLGAVLAVGDCSPGGFRTRVLREERHSLTEGPVFPEPLASGFRSARWVGRRDSRLDYRQPLQTHKVAFTVFISIFYTVTLFL